METKAEAPPQKTSSPAQKENTTPELSSPPLISPPNSIISPSKTGTPDRLKLPRAFKFAEKYTSPTDRIMSPISRRLMSRSRKGCMLLPVPLKNQAKIQGLQQLDQEAGHTIQDLTNRT